jgi:murein DD-endopeptidase MepM/ murein hydrolase activator NlpD
LVIACGGGSPKNQGVLIEPATSTEAPASNGDTTPVLQGFIYPIAGACLPKGDQLMPNAVRAYRQGIHEGVDFYASDNCTAITRGTLVMAAKSGKVVRADLNYTDLTAADVKLYLANPTTDEAFDKFRGRQVWVDHGGGVVTRYCHLSGIASGITVGMTVTAGQTIAFVGESGTPESVSNPGSENHLHFEVRVGDTYLGKGQAPATVRGLFQTLFSPLSP